MSIIISYSLACVLKYFGGVCVRGGKLGTVSTSGGVQSGATRTGSSEARSCSVLASSVVGSSLADFVDSVSCDSCECSINTSSI